MAHWSAKVKLYMSLLSEAESYHMMVMLKIRARTIRSTEINGGKTSIAALGRQALANSET